MRRFSFFSSVRGGPGLIRGLQMAEKLGGRFNPEEGYENDTCIFVIGTVPKKEPEHAYHDVMDGGIGRCKRVRTRTRGPVIALSLVHQEALRKIFGNREVIRIPQHHCNYEGNLREDRPVKRVGVIGGDSAFQWPHHAIERMFGKVGMEWAYCGEYNRRHKCVKYYNELDVQVSWRPTHARGLVNHMNCLKLANAGSFGIPTVAFPEPAYKREWADECLFADTITGLIDIVKKLRDERGFYQEMSGRVREKAKEYHIDRIAELYRGLQ